MMTNWKIHVASLSGYIVLGIMMTFPVAFEAHQYILAEHLDTTAALYNFWWFYQAIFELHTSPWFNPLINYPENTILTPHVASFAGTYRFDIEKEAMENLLKGLRKQGISL